jgi:hypothetical protein
MPHPSACDQVIRRISIMIFSATRLVVNRRGLGGPVAQRVDHERIVICRTGTSTSVQVRPVFLRLSNLALMTNKDVRLKYNR